MFGIWGFSYSVLMKDNHSKSNLKLFEICQVVCFLMLLALKRWRVFLLLLFSLWSAKVPGLTEQLLSLVTFKVAYSRVTQRDH